MTGIGEVRERLSEIRPPGLNRDIVAAGLVREVDLQAGVVTVRFMPGPLPPPIVDPTAAVAVPRTSLPSATPRAPAPPRRSAPPPKPDWRIGSAWRR